MTTFDNDYIDLKNAHIDHLTLRVREVMGRPNVRPVAFNLPAAPPLIPVFPRRCRLFGFTIVNLDAGAQVVTVGGPGVDLVTNVFSASLAAGATASPAQLFIAAGILMADGLAVLSAGATKGVALLDFD